MSWSYSGDPSASDLDAVRFIVGDTDEEDQLLQDEEIEYFLDIYDDVARASAYSARAIASRFARLADKSVGDLSLSASQKYEQYMALYDELETHLRREMAGFFAGGISRSKKLARELDSDRVKPSFKRGITDNPNVANIRSLYLAYLPRIEGE